MLAVLTVLEDALGGGLVPFAVGFKLILLPGEDTLREGLLPVLRILAADLVCDLLGVTVSASLN